MCDERFLDEGRRCKRKLTKHNSNPQDIVVQEYLCISGGWARKPLYLDVTDFQGTSMVGIHSTSAWLPQVLQGFCRYQSLGALLKSASQDLQAEVFKTSADAEKAQLSRASELRAGLWDDDEDEEAGAPSTPSGKKAVADRRRLKEPSIVSLRGHSLTVAWRRQTIYVAATSESLASLVQILRTYTKDEVASKSPEKPKEQNKDSDEADENQGCVKTWVVRYVDSDGKKRTRTKGLSVPEKSFDGSVLDIDEYKRIRNEVRSKAVNIWNDMDCSDRPRL